MNSAIYLSLFRNLGRIREITIVIIAKNHKNTVSLGGIWNPNKNNRVYTEIKSGHYPDLFFIVCF